MDNMVLIQLYSFIIYIVSGIIIGIFFDIFRILRKSFKTSDILTYIEDILFWLCSAIFLLFVLFKLNNGEIRSYTIIGLLLGVLLYMLTISKYFIKLNVKILTFFKKIIGKIINIILIPIKVLFNILKKIIFKPFTFFVINIKKKYSNFCKKTKNKLKKPKKIKKDATERRILKRNVEKYN